MSYLILVRHGQSRWNLDNKFTGWVDVPLSEKGIREAQKAAKYLEKLNIDYAFTSTLERAQETLLIILAKQKKTGIFLHKGKKRHTWSNHPKQFDKNEIPIFSSQDINERYYGKLQGQNKDAMRKKYGEEQVFIWRRSFDVRPPGGESLKDVYKRTIPYFKKKIFPTLKKGDVVVSAHGNSLRSIIKYLDNISDEEIPHLELATGKPVVYKYSKGKLTKMKDDFKFNRPTKWKE
jgi:2,3-bisphosphoglycerate-dependent phosphoglycerate mutase